MVRLLDFSSFGMVRLLDLDNYSPPGLVLPETMSLVNSPPGLALPETMNSPPGLVLPETMSLFRLLDLDLLELRNLVFIDNETDFY
ncbi:9396_t:CDS:2 [Funneliformis geosporum]|nr:9396_t:CDS:2 [Funneliformis geosporum]